MQHVALEDWITHNNWAGIDDGFISISQEFSQAESESPWNFSF